MKLDWEMNEFRVLVAEAGAVTYYVAPGVINLWEPSKRYTTFDGKVATVWPIEGGVPLTNAIAWCERDAERPEECPAQPPSAPAPEPPSVEERAADLKGQSLDDLRDELKRLKREVAALRPEPPSVEEQIENLAWGLKNETKRAAERDNEIAERLEACETRLTQLVASKCQALDHRINSAVAPINRELGELRALVQELQR